MQNYLNLQELLIGTELMSHINKFEWKNRLSVHLLTSRDCESKARYFSLYLDPPGLGGELLENAYDSS